MNMILRILAESISPGNLPGAPTPANPTPNSLTSVAALQTILGVVFGIIGALALLIITVSGLRYITSAGDPEKTTRARNGIIYALVGLILAISAEAIVAFGVKRL